MATLRSAFQIGVSYIGGRDVIGGSPSAVLDGIASTGTVGTITYRTQARPTGVTNTSTVGTPSLTAGTGAVVATGVANTSTVGTVRFSLRLPIVGVASSSRVGRVDTLAGREGTFGWSTFGAGTFGGSVAPPNITRAAFQIGRSYIGGRDVIGAGQLHTYLIVGQLWPTGSVGTIAFRTQVLVAGVPSAGRVGAPAFRGAPILLSGIASVASVGVPSFRTQAHLTGVASTSTLGTIRTIGLFHLVGVASTSRVGRMTFTVAVIRTRTLGVIVAVVVNRVSIEQRTNRVTLRDVRNVGTVQQIDDVAVTRGTTSLVDA